MTLIPQVYDVIPLLLNKVDFKKKIQNKHTKQATQLPTLPVRMYVSKQKYHFPY